MDEEARHDEVFARLKDHPFEHAEAAKIIGDPSRPASAVVFGEKGSGKTAIRLQIEERFDAYNSNHPDSKSLIVAYDDLNPVLDRFARRLKERDPKDALKQLTLNDQIDGILSVAVPDLVDAALDWSGHAQVSAGEGAVRRFPVPDGQVMGKLDQSIRRDWLVLQALYDRPEQAVARSGALKRRLSVLGINMARPLRWLATSLWIITMIGAVWYGWFTIPEPQWLLLATVIVVGLLAAATTALAARNWLRVNRISRQLSRQLRALDRSAASYRQVFERLPRSIYASTSLPIDDIDETRYEMLKRLRRIVRPLGYTQVVILIDRVDEPSLVRGKQERMRAVVWPLFNNKFLQQPGIAIKMMLPIELRYALYGQSRDFFQEARLDKQNMIDRLEWPGEALYDLCNRRLSACANGVGAPIPSLHDFFAEDVSREELVRALDQMRQPRDAFKLLYRTIQRHCTHMPDEAEPWHISRHTLHAVLDQQKERLDALRGGLAPA